MEVPARSALLCHLDPSLQSELREALADPELNICTYTCSEFGECSQFSRAHQPDILFCPLSDQFPSLLAGLDPPIPVIVVSRVPDSREWIDAMEAGACDYCAPPFDRAQLRWMLSAAEHSSPHVATHA